MLKAARRPLILCVEDEPLLLRDLCEELEESGYQAIGVPDVPAALLVLARLTPALVLCDISLPGQSGYDLLAELRESEQLSHIPFVLLTALGGREHMLQGTRAGADDYLVKPVDYDLLLATVATRLALVQRLQRQHQHQLQRSVLEVHDHWHGVLDNLGHCALVCDGHLHIRFANRAAHALGLGHASGPSPVLQDAAGQLALQPVLALHAGVQAFLHSDAESACIDVPAQATGPLHWCLRIQALHERSAEPGQTEADLRQQRYALFITELRQATRPSAETLAERFALTPAETQVASLLADGLNKQQISERLSISASTVAFHLRNLFTKTRTGRQAELVAVLLTLADPAVPNTAAMRR